MLLGLSLQTVLGYLSENLGQIVNDPIKPTTFLLTLYSASADVAFATLLSYIPGHYLSTQRLAPASALSDEASWLPWLPWLPVFQVMCFAIRLKNVRLYRIVKLSVYGQEPRTRYTFPGTTGLFSWYARPIYSHSSINQPLSPSTPTDTLLPLTSHLWSLLPSVKYHSNTSMVNKCKLQRVTKVYCVGS